MHCCWTCGEETATSQDMFVHMRQSHEEGVDYIECPLCHDLIVDTIIHFSRAHQGTPLPSGMQMRITGVAHDFRTVKAQEAKKESRRKYRQGFFDSAKNGKKLHYRSGWELDCYKILENSFAVKQYFVEPFPIPYLFGGVVKNYWPDILVVFIDDDPQKPSRALIEVKPLDQCPNKDGKAETFDQARNDAKWQAADNFSRQKGMEFVVWTERSIIKLSKFHKAALTKTAMIGSDDQQA